MKILFLYTELAAYTVACLNQLAESANVLVIHYPINSEAPFKFEKHNNFKRIEKNSVSVNQLENTVPEFNPDIIFCSGWSDKQYVKICGAAKKKGTPVVLCMDNKWEFSMKKIAAVILSRVFLLNKFSAAWVPGEKQCEYARRLGFQKIFKGFYCADTTYWNDCYEKTRNQKQLHFPKVILYAGRYYEFKGLKFLWEAFKEFKKGKGKDWQLWCAGTGELEPEKSDGIRHLGFVQPAEMEKYLAQCGVFVFPSLFEPWGVAVHEFAAAGFPLLLSTEVGASGQFLVENKNGYSFKAASKTELLKALNKIADTNDNDLVKMCAESNKIAMSYTVAGWSENALHIAKSLI